MDPVVTPPVQSPTPGRADAPIPGYGLAITGLVLACIFFIPLVALAGLIISIVALVKLPPGKKTLGIVGVCIGGISSFLMVGIMAAIAIPSFVQYVAKSKASEGRINTRHLATAVAAYHAETDAWPADTDWTPAGNACDQPDKKFPVPPGSWQAEPWRTLHFQIDRPHFFQYRIRPNGPESGGVRVEARADLDCDGRYSSYVILVDNAGPHPLETENELE